MNTDMVRIGLLTHLSSERKLDASGLVNILQQLRTRGQHVRSFQHQGLQERDEATRLQRVRV